jgi:1,4-alpha-glucan branching enzyme
VRQTVQTKSSTGTNKNRCGLVLIEESHNMSVAAATKAPETFSRHFPIGAEIVPEGGVHFRVWALDHQNVEVIVESENQGPGHEVCRRLRPENDGYFSGYITEARPGARYRFRLGGGPQSYPDPASRFQPQGPHGASEVIDPTDFKWTDNDWKGIGREGQVLYEMHIGTFSKEGTWEAAESELAELAAWMYGIGVDARSKMVHFSSHSTHIMSPYLSFSPDFTTWNGNW